MNAAQLLNHFDRISDTPGAIPPLRRFILDLAVRGKLAKQDPNDVPASELLKRIQTEKARFMKTGRIRRQEPTPQVELKDQPFEVPTSWEWVRFGGIADFSAGRTPSRHDLRFWNTGEHSWVSIADMKDGGVVVRTKETVSQKAKNEVFSSEPAPVGTLIMSFKLTIGKISRLGIPAFHNEAIISIHPHLPAMEAYLFMVLPRFSQQGVKKDAIKGATLNRDSISNITIPLPPLDEQHRIVAKVDELMALCDRLEAAQAERETRGDRLAAASLHRLNQPADGPAFRECARFYFNHLPRLTTRPEHIKQLRQTILNLAVHGKLVPQDPNDEPASELFKRIRAEKKRLVREGEAKEQKQLRLDAGDDEPFDLPKTWLWVSLGDVAFEFRYGTSVKCSYEPKGQPVLRIPNIDSGRINIEDLKYGPLSACEADDLRLQLGDILMVRSNGSLSLVGRPALVEAHAVGFCYAGYLVRVRTSVVHLDARYLLLALNTAHVRDQVEIPIRTTVGLKNVNATELSRLMIPLPPLAEQHRIVAKVEELMALCDRLEAQLTITQTESRRHLKAVLHQALSQTT